MLRGRDVEQIVDVTHALSPHSKMKAPKPHSGIIGSVWARPGMTVTFRAELMPGKSAAERTFRINRVLPNRRVLVEGISGEHTATEFETTK